MTHLSQRLLEANLDELYRSLKAMTAANPDFEDYEQLHSKDENQSLLFKGFQFVYMPKELNPPPPAPK